MYVCVREKEGGDAGGKERDAWMSSEVEESIGYLEFHMVVSHPISVLSFKFWSSGRVSAFNL